MSTTTDKMSLVIPSVNDSDYPTSISTSLELIDEHTHISGQGNQIPTAGIADNAITTAKIASLNVTRAKLVAVGQQISSSSGAFSTTSSSYVDVTNLSVTITTTGRPIMIGLIPDGNLTFTSGILLFASGVTDNLLAVIALLEGATIISETTIGRVENAAVGTMTYNTPLGGINFIRPVAAGTYTYKVQVKQAALSTATTIDINYAKLFAYEL